MKVVDGAFIAVTASTMLADRCSCQGRTMVAGVTSWTWACMWCVL